MPLAPEEQAVLPLLLRVRMALSLVNGAASVARDPDNASYLLMTQRPGWRLLRMLVGTTDEQLRKRLLRN